MQETLEISKERGSITSLTTPVTQRVRTKFNEDHFENEEIGHLRWRVLINRHHYLTKILSGEVFSSIQERYRSPSPPPVYDTDTGQRINTREQRTRDKLDLERKVCMSEAFRINPDVKTFLPLSPPSKELNIFIPHSRHPGYNFIGLILGHRGCTQKRLEFETGAKVTIKTKKTIKNWQMCGDMHRQMPMESNEESYVHIVADSWDKIDALAELVEPLLTYIDDERNIHKRNQMLQLAKNTGMVPTTQFKNDKASELAVLQKSSGPIGQDPTELYQTSDYLTIKIAEQYRRDIEAVKGKDIKNTAEQFRLFMSELKDVKPLNRINTDLSLPLLVKSHDFSRDCGRIHINPETYTESRQSPYGGFPPRTTKADK
jgi:hypothetical protein